MSKIGETFFTVVGCMDGRCQAVVAKYGARKFGASYPDTITDAGIVKHLSFPKADYLLDVQKKLLISIDRHNSKGIVVVGHAECAGNPVDDETHKGNIRDAVSFVRVLAGDKVSVAGVFVKRDNNGWTVEEL